jgi:uncharacterized protein (TIGR01440 family)
MDWKATTLLVKEAAETLLSRAEFKKGQLFILGCSTSEIQGKHIGKAGSVEVANLVLKPLWELAKTREFFLAVQCCEHLNRVLVVEAEAVEKYGLEEVRVYPVPEAGGAVAAVAMELFSEPVVVEKVQGHAGLDFGQTLIGMHLKPVAVPVRLPVKFIGSACVTAARTRPKLIGGKRAAYDKPGSLLSEEEK